MNPVVKAQLRVLVGSAREVRAHMEEDLTYDPPHMTCHSQLLSALMKHSPSS